MSDETLAAAARRAGADGTPRALAALWRSEERAGRRDPALTRLRARLGDPAARLLYDGEPELPVEQVRLAASLGHAEAMRLHPGVEPADWSWEGRKRTITAAREYLGEALPARVAADWAERALPVWERYAPGDRRPHEAIAAARAWADCPCEEHRTSAEAAADAAWAVASDSTSNAKAAAADAAWAAASAADAAWAAASAADAADAAADAAWASAAGWASEHEWQRLRLAAYLAGEVML